MKKRCLVFYISIISLLACKPKAKNTAQLEPNFRVSVTDLSSVTGGRSDTTKKYTSVKSIQRQEKDLNYKQDTLFNGKTCVDVVYLSGFGNAKICALGKDKFVYVIDDKGRVIQCFNTKLKGSVSALSADENNLIYIFSNEEKSERFKHRGREVTKVISLGLTCTIFNEKGKKLECFQLGSLKSATGASVRNGKIVVSDALTNKVAVYDQKSGNTLSLIDGMRQCGGLLDVSVNKSNEIMVANLGAFRVDVFSMSSKHIVSWGERGAGLEHFHGCCNPVSLSSLNNGSIVTVEKYPTRIKVYGNNGVKVLPQVNELKACKDMSCVTDSANNIYVSAGEQGIIKFVIQN